jgi:tRNA-Thr(GGU) m(6)t(6)A37 methyltransferase TsaA
MISFEPIGTVHSPYHVAEDMPIQASAARGVRGTVEVFPRFAAGLKDLDGFSHVILLYHFHAASAPKLLVVPYLDTELRGVFATRAPARPNPIGLSVVRLIRVAGAVLEVEGVDVIDGTPLLDIKPYVPRFDGRRAERIGWLSKRVAGMNRNKSDKRFGG